MTDPIEEARDFLRTLDPSHDTIDRIFAPVVDECERLRAALAAAESKIAEVTAERDEAYERGRRRGREDVGRLHDALAKIERVLGRKPEPVEFLARAVAEVKAQKEAAESALARAMEAMPTQDVIRFVTLATVLRNCEGSEEEPLQQESLDWLARLDAFRASQAETKGGE